MGGWTAPLTNAERQQAYRKRKSEADRLGDKALVKMYHLEEVVALAVQNGTLPASILENSDFGDWFDNLIEYLSKQQSLIR